MPMVASDLAAQLKNGLGFSSQPTSSQVLGMATAIIAAFATALVSNAPGTVTGTAPPSGGPLINGAASNGVIAGMTGAALASLIQSNAGFPSVSPQLLSFSTALVTHFLTASVSFSSGSIVGVCTNTAGPPPTPGALTLGAGTNGKISGLSGSALASLLASALGQSDPTPIQNFANNLITYIQSNATVTYAPGTITAVIPAGGGSITLGTGADGLIT